MVDIAQAAFRTGNFELASDIYERLIKETGPACELYTRLGEALSLSGKLNEAFAAYSKAFRLGKVEPDRLTSLVTALVNVARSGMTSLGIIQSKSDKQLKDFANNEPFGCANCLGLINDPITVACGHSYCKKCLAKMEVDLCIVCGRNPSTPNGFKTNVLLNGILTKLVPVHCEISCLKAEGNRLFEIGDHDGAATKYSEAIGKAPLDHILWSNRSNIFASMKKYEEALNDASESVKLQPAWAKGYFRQGVALSGLGRHQEAALAYMKCLAVDAEASAAHSSLVEILQGMLQPAAVGDSAKVPSAVHVAPVSAIVSQDNAMGGVEQVRLLLDSAFGRMENSASQAVEGSGELEGETSHGSKSMEGRHHQCLLLAELRAHLDDSEGLLCNDDFECSLCYRLLYEPVTTPCGHSFCRVCLDRSLDHSTDCPQCRGNLSEYLAQRRQAITISIETILKTWFTKAYAERQKIHEEEIVSFASSAVVGEIPVFVCTIAFPTIPCPLHVFEPRYRLMIRQCMETGTRQFGMCLYDSNIGFVDVGTMLEVRDVQYFPDGRSVVDTIGSRRFRVLERGTRDGYSTAKVQFLEDTLCTGEDLQELQRLHNEVHECVSSWVMSLPPSVKARIEQHFGCMPPVDALPAADPQAQRNGPRWTWWVVAMLPIDPRAQTAILGMTSLRERLLAIRRVVNYVRSRQQR